MVAERMVMQPAQRLCLAGLRTSTMLMRLFHQTDTIPVSAASIFTFRDEFTRHNRVVACRRNCIHANKFIVCRAKNKADFSMGVYFYNCRSGKKRQLHFFPHSRTCMVKFIVYRDKNITYMEQRLLAIAVDVRQ